MKKMKNPIYSVLSLLFLSTIMVAQGVANKKQSQSESEKKAIAIEKEMREKFYEKAKQANLNKEKTDELVNLIDERNRVMKELHSKKSIAELSFSVQDPHIMLNNKITYTQNQYDQKIIKALTYEQFSQFVFDDYKEDAGESAKNEFLKIAEKTRFNR